MGRHLDEVGGEPSLKVLGDGVDVDLIIPHRAVHLRFGGSSSTRTELERWRPSRFVGDTEDSEQYIEGHQLQRRLIASSRWDLEAAPVGGVGRARSRFRGSAVDGAARGVEGVGVSEDRRPGCERSSRLMIVTSGCS
jgi:hypothetical protein